MANDALEKEYKQTRQDLLLLEVASRNFQVKGYKVA